MTDHAGKTVVITGASRGLGRRLAGRFWSLGANLVLVARDKDALEDLQQTLVSRTSTEGQRATVIALDIADTMAAESIVGQATGQNGRLDVLICNAATQGPIGPLWSNRAAEWRRTIEVNLVAPAMLAAAVSPFMIARGSGTILFLAGGGASNARPNFSAYATAKAGIVRLAETLASELVDTGVTVNAIAPGVMPTAMLEEVARSKSSGDHEVAVAERVLADGNDTMERAGDLAIFLASDAARGITGKLISAVWDRYEDWPAHIEELAISDLYTLRRITGRDRGTTWGDK